MMRLVSRTSINILTAMCLVAISLLLLSETSRATSLDSISAGEWFRVPDTNMSAVLPDPLPSGNTGPEAIMSAWSGAALDTSRDRLIVWGGGHADYAGNELYAFDLDTLSWSRVTDPSATSGGSEATGVFGDGRPRSTHTYHTLAYSPKADRFYFVGMGGVWSGGSRNNRTGAFDFVSGEWVELANRPNVGVPEAGVTVYDSATESIWHQAGWTSQLLRLDLATNDWNEFPAAGGAGVDLYASAAIDPDRRLMVVAGGGHFIVWNLDRPSERLAISTSGPDDIVRAKAPGFAYDSNAKVFVGWQGGSSVYTLDPETWRWEERQADPSNTVVPTSPASTGTYGRFQYVPSKNVFVLVNSIREDVYIYRLSTSAQSEETTPSAMASTLCDSQGVVKCVGFDTDSEVIPFLLPAGDGSLRGALDSSIYANGGGSLRFEIPSNTGANSSGSWLSDLGDDFSAGDRFYVSFKQRFSRDFLEQRYGGGGWKQVIIHGANASCASVELTTQNTFHRGFPQMYTDCGGRSFDVDLGNGDFLLQQGYYNCHYQNQNANDCSYYRPDQWITFYYEIELGQWGTETSDIRAYIAYEGGALKQFIDMKNYRLDYNDSPADAYNRIQLTPYHTGKDSSLSHAVGYTWYDDLVVSTEPLFQIEVGPEPKAPTNLTSN